MSLFGCIKDILEIWFIMELCFVQLKLYIGGFVVLLKLREVELANLSRDQATKLSAAQLSDT
jgi:hypothetical protein